MAERPLNEDDEGQEVADDADDDDQRTGVDVQLLVKSVGRDPHQPTLVRLHVHLLLLRVLLTALCMQGASYFHAVANRVGRVASA